MPTDLTLLTTTGARPEAWALCKHWMRAQRFDGTVHWIIVDDGQKPQLMIWLPESWRITLVHPSPSWQPGENTQRRNLAAGLDHVGTADLLAIIEDDDFYGPDYLSVTFDRLSKADLVGEENALYFNLRTMTGKRCGNFMHASLCQTAMKGRAIDALRESVNLNLKFIDMKLWQNYGGSKLLGRSTHCIGIKGLPGRGGIGAGHRIRVGDVTAAEVKSIMGSEAWAMYAPYLGGQDD